MKPITIRLDTTDLDRLARRAGGTTKRIVADGVEYGLYQEMGTVYMDAHPFMRPALEAVRPGFEKAWDDVITLEQAEQVVEKTARDVERLAKIRAPVDTGALRNSIHVIGGGQ